MRFALLAVAIGLLVLSSATAAGVEQRNGLIAIARQNAGLQDQIFVMRPDGNGQHALTQGAPGARQPAWSPDGNKIAFTDGRDRLKVMNADGTGTRTLAHESGDAGDASAQWSPDGKRLVFVVNHGFDKKKYLTTIGANGKAK